jgi:hypothetical protein
MLLLAEDDCRMVGRGRPKRLTEKKAGDFGPVVIPSCLRFDEEAQHGLDQNHP